MKVVIALLAMSGTAAASAIVTPPAGWSSDPEHAATVADKVKATRHLGGAPVVVAAETYTPAAGDVALIVTRISTEALAGTREAAARAEIDDLHASASNAYDWRELPADDRRVVGARGEWTGIGGGTQSVGIVVIAASDKKLVAVRGECFSADKASGEDVDACKRALDTLDPGIPVAERVVFAAAPAGAPPAPHEDLKLPEPSRLTDGQDVHLAPISVAQPRPEADRRPIYLGAGIVVLAAVFWWNRRRREQFERGDEKPVRRARGGDDDADDLAAAARGDGAKDDEA